jgi:hypothetical protein
MDVHRAVMKEVEKAKKREKNDLTPAQKAVALALGDNVRLWSDPMDGTAYVSVLVDGHWENYRIDGVEFEDWVRVEFGKRHWKEIDDRRVETHISQSQLNEGIATLGAHARRGTNKITPVIRIGGDAEVVWLDLVRKDWLLIRVTRDGWEKFAGGMPGVAFVRKDGMLELPRPERARAWAERGVRGTLRRLINAKDEEDRVLQAGWLLGALRYRGPYPLALFTGPPGVAKTAGCKAMAGMIDPNFVDLMPIGGPDDIYVASFNRYVLGFDNISDLSVEQSDALCRLCTGTGYGKRKLHTDAKQFMMRVCRPIVLNGLPHNLAERSDLADRAIVLELPVLDEDTQLGEEEFAEMLEEARPRVLGGLLDGVVGAMRGWRDVSLDGYGRVRMKDFARWAEAGCRALGFEEGEFLTAFVANQERAMRIAFKENYVAQAVVMLMEQHADPGGGWRGNAVPLLEALRKAVVKAGRAEMLVEKRWPTTDGWLGRRLREAVPILRRLAGIEIEFGVDLRKTHEGDKDRYSITKRGRKAVGR